MSNAVFLRIYEAEKQLEVKQFDGDQIVIGRKAKVDVDLADESVSPIHAMIEKRGATFYLCDLGSEVGTLKNGEKIIDVALTTGDQIAIGPYNIEFYIGEPKPKATPPSIPAAAASDSLLDTKTELDVGSTHVEGEDEDTKTINLSAIDIDQPAIGEDTVITSAPLKTGKKSTFAPKSPVKSATELLDTSKGPVVEVVVAWKERIIDTYHFDEKGQVILGGHEQCDIYLPVFGNKNIQHTLLDIGMQTTILISPNMTGDIESEGKTSTFAEATRSGRLSRNDAGYTLTLTQGEIVRAELPGETVTLFIRFVANSPKPLLAPMLDLNLPEMVSIATSVFMAFFLSLYVSIKVPKNESQKLLELAKTRTATILVKPPELPEPEKPKPEVIKKIEKLPPLTVKKEKPKKEVPKVKKTVKKSIKTVTKTKKKEGKSARIAPKNLPKAPKKVTTTRPTKKILKRKLSPKPGTSAATKKKDISKVGILGVLGSSGTMKKIDKESSGVGILQGLAEKATGGVGEDSNAIGDSIGTPILDVGRGGEGVATIGIENVGTKGRGSGQSGYGRAGIGSKKNIEVKLGDDENDFLGKIDREAIRRVVQKHLRQIKSCYDRALNRQPDLAGKVVLQWVIGEQGTVSSPKVRKDKTTMNSNQVSGCIINHLKTWIFPEPPDGMQAEVSYPFLFKSVN